MALIAFLDDQIETLRQQIQSHIDDHSDLKDPHDLLTSIPGIGHKTAAIILGELQNINRFDQAKQVTAFAGLTPQQMQSGQSHQSRGLVKMGSVQLRTALYFPALSAMRFNPILKTFADPLNADRSKHKMSVVAAVRRKLLHLIYGILKSGKPFDPDYVVSIHLTA